MDSTILNDPNFDIPNIIYNADKQFDNFTPILNQYDTERLQYYCTRYDIFCHIHKVFIFDKSRYTTASSRRAAYLSECNDLTDVLAAIWVELGYIYPINGHPDYYGKS